ncbi:MAG: hypothetical protein NT133_06095 [Alphaproteobacteria bacterium]|nr:hypothetical protein [Alphaproteobacteria bacterium]
MKYPVTLSINESEIGAFRAHRLFQACRAFAQRIDPQCYIMADFVDFERVGWTFDMPSSTAAFKLRVYHDTIMRKPVY